MTKKSNTNFYFIVAISILISVATMALVTTRLFDQAKQNAVIIGERAAELALEDINEFLKENSHVISFVGDRVDIAIEKGETNEEIKDLLVESMNIYRKNFDETFTGFYGVLHGKFISSKMSVPENYEFKNRYWYQEAMKLKPNETIMTSPYVDVFTGKKVISFVTRLDRDDNCMAFDIDVDILEQKARNIVKDKSVLSMFFLDANSTVVAGVHPSHGTNYLRGDAGEEKKAAAKRLELASGIVHIDYDDVVVFVCRLDNNWRAVTVVDKQSLYSDTYDNVAILIVGNIIVVLILFLFCNYSIQKRRHAEQFSDSLRAIGEIFTSIAYIDLHDRSFRMLKSFSHLNDLIRRADTKNASKLIKTAIRESTSDEYVNDMLKFTDLTDIASRIGERNTISREFIGLRLGWCIARFIVVDRDDYGMAKSVLFTVTDINAAKREAERLFKESHVDKLTSIYNRRAYDERIEKLLQEPLKDDFVYVTADVNGLKNVNDNIGHDAGDELIKVSAEILRIVFRPHGNIFRIGGDEFCALLHIDAKELPELITEINKLTESYTGIHIEGVSISVGYAAHADHPDLSLKELAHEADLRMYESKAEYYKENGIERRTH